MALGLKVISNFGIGLMIHFSMFINLLFLNKNGFDKFSTDPSVTTFKAPVILVNKK